MGGFIKEDRKADDRKFWKRKVKKPSNTKFICRKFRKGGSYVKYKKVALS
jgi:hypothetical protein